MFFARFFKRPAQLLRLFQFCSDGVFTTLQCSGVVRDGGVDLQRGKHPTRLVREKTVHKLCVTGEPNFFFSPLFLVHSYFVT